jgi:hypothetical protein
MGRRPRGFGTSPADRQFIDRDETAFAVDLRAGGLAAHHAVLAAAWDRECLDQFLDGLAATGDLMRTRAVIAGENDIRAGSHTGRRRIPLTRTFAQRDT